MSQNYYRINTLDFLHSFVIQPYKKACVEFSIEYIPNFLMKIYYK